MGLFWLLFMGFFMYLFPFLFTPLATLAQPQMPYLVLGITIFLWLLFILFLINRLILKPQRTYQETLHLQQQGESIPAQVIRNRVIKTLNGEDSLELILRFTNNNHSIIDLLYYIVDSKPHLNRFEEGKTLMIKLNDSEYGHPIVLAEGKLTSTHSPLLAWGFILFNIAYVIFSFFYWKNQVNYGNEFMSFTHPWFINSLINMLIIFMMTKSFGSTGSNILNNRLISHGIKTEATVLSANQTGYFVNEQPQLNIHLELLDQHNQKIRVNKKQIVPLTLLHRFDQEKLGILYNPSNPNEFIFTQDLT